MSERFTYRYNEECAMIQIVDNYKKEPNANSMCNVKDIVNSLNRLNNEIQYWKQQLNKVISENNIEYSMYDELLLEPFKRFRIENIDEKCIVDLVPNCVDTTYVLLDRYRSYDLERICDLLNELEMRNEMLKEELEEVEQELDVAKSIIR